MASEIITTIVTALKDFVTGLASAFKTGFTEFLYVDPASASPVLSAVAIYSMVIVGAVIGIGLVRLLLNTVRNPFRK